MGEWVQVFPYQADHELVVVGIDAMASEADVVRQILFGVEPYDPQVLIGAVLLCLLASTTTCYFPAWRAARVDPLKAVRAE